MIPTIRDFFASIRNLVRWYDFDVKHLNGRHANHGKYGRLFWRVKFQQQLEIEKSRVVIDDKMYMITAKDGVLSELL